MPYMMEGNDVYKVGADGKPMGKPMNKKPMSKKQAQQYMAALNAATADGSKSLSEPELIALEEKCYSDMAQSVNKLSPDDPRATYDPMGGRTGDKACANCRWFHPGSSSCDLIYGEIVPTGVSNLWLSKEMPADPSQPKPIPVVIVEPDVNDDDSGAMDMGSMANKANPDEYAYVPDKEAPSTWKLPIGDEKHARLALAAIGSNSPHGNKVNIPSDAMPGVRRKIEAAIRKFVKDKDEVKKLIGGKSLLEQFFEFVTGAKSEETTTEGFKVYPDGRWTAWWTNNAKDRTSENFQAKEIDAYIARVDKGLVSYPELWFKHLPIRMGKADALARIGYLAFATGTFYDTPLGQKAKDYYLAEQKAGRPKTNSHGYLYPSNLKRNGVYGPFNTFEISILDPGEEANPYTSFEVKTMFAKLDQKKFDELVRIFGKDEVEKLVNFADTKSRELETAGVDLKSFSSFEGVELQDKEAHERVKALAEATVEGLKTIHTRLDEIAASIKTAQDTATQAKTESATAVAELKAYIDEQFSYAPRASKAAQTKLPGTDPQVAHLDKANKEAAQQTTDPNPTDVSEFGKSIFKHIFEAAGAQPSAQ